MPTEVELKESTESESNTDSQKYIIFLLEQIRDNTKN